MFAPIVFSWASKAILWCYSLRSPHYLLSFDLWSLEVCIIQDWSLSETSCQPIADRSTIAHRSISYSLTCCSSDDIVKLAATISSFSTVPAYSMTISAYSWYAFASAASGVPERQVCAQVHSDRRGCRKVCDYYYYSHRIGCAGHLLGGRNLSHLRIGRHRYLFLMKLLKFSRLIQVSSPLSCRAGWTSYH